MTLVGCAHLDQFPKATDAVDYVWTDADAADMTLTLSLSMYPIGQFRQDEWHFRIVDKAHYHGPFRGGAPSTCADGPTRWYNSSISFGPSGVTSSGILFHAHCSFKEAGLEGVVNEPVFVPFKWSGSAKSDQIAFTYSWRKIAPQQGGRAYPPPAARHLQGKSRATGSGSAHP